MERTERGIRKFAKYTLQTQRMIKDYLKSAAVGIINFEIGKERMFFGDICISNELFDYLDQNNVFFKYF